MRLPKVDASRVVKAGSRLHGYGLFARVDLKRAQRVIQYVGPAMGRADYERVEGRRAKASSSSGLVYFFQVARDHFIDGNVAANLARFINHSCNPNCESYVYRREVWIRALRDIPAGTELTYDYGFDDEEALMAPCRCGEKLCLGFIVSKAYRRSLKKRLPVGANAGMDVSPSLS